MQSTTTAEEKALLRAQLRQRLAAMTSDQLRREDEALFDAFCRLPQLACTQTVFLFWGMGREPDTARLALRLLKMDKQVVLPRVLPGRRMEARLYRPDLPLVRHPFGMLEPSQACPVVPPQEISLALVPALCYDRLGYRLGFGGGYYDRWLDDFHGFSAGLCREEFLLDHLPHEAHDRPVCAVVTPQAVLFPASDPVCPQTRKSGAAGPAL